MLVEWYVHLRIMRIEFVELDGEEVISLSGCLSRKNIGMGHLCLSEQAKAI